MTAPREIAAVILAAGAGHRLGGVAKALLLHRGASYLAAIAATARSVGLADAVVVVGRPFGAAVAAHAEQLGLRVQINPDPDRGMASSVALGFAALSEGPATADTLHRLIAALDGRTERSGGEIEVVRPCHKGRRGHPPLIARALWPELVGSAGRAGGAREVVRASRLVDVEVDDPGVLHDVDTPADREALG
jgi:molybdenum cofactor cytidylyltransferase